MRSKILVTGSAGFIFSNFMRKVIKEYPQYDYVSVDQILETYNLRAAKNNKDHQFYMGDVADQLFMNNVFNIEKPDYVIHGAAQSFVDDAIKGAGPFIHSNVVGTQVIVDMAVKYGIKKFIYISTDEVYGHLTSKTDVSWTEEVAPKPRNPYSASKYAGEIILYAANQTHNLNFNITRCCNNYGASQPPRNLTPRILTCLINDKLIPIHGDGQNIREWIYVEDHCSAIMKVLEDGEDNEIYNVGTGIELTNIEMVNIMAEALNKRPKISFIKDRKGHDFRYSVNCEKIKKLGWSPQFNFEQGIEKTIKWYMDNNWYFNA